MIEVRKRENENVGGLIMRFTKKVRRSGVIMETRKRRFHDRPVTRRRRKSSAIFREGKRKDMTLAKKLGTL